MRPSSIALFAVAFTLACADAPTSTLLEPEGASRSLGKAPPPWALIEGVITTDGGGTEALASVSLSLSGDGSGLMSHVPGGSNTATYRAWILATPGNQATLLRFTDGGTNVTFSNGAMITKVNGKVSGRGTMVVGGHSYELSAVTQFEFYEDCATIPGFGPCASFNTLPATYFASGTAGSIWTGTLSNDGGGDFDLPPGWDHCKREGCYCVNCEVTVDGYTTKRGGRR